MTNLIDLGFEQKGSFKPVDPGTYDAVVHGIVSLGVQAQKDDPVTKEPKPPKGTLKIIFEMPDVVRDDGQTALISKNMILSNHEKSGYYKLFAACLGQTNTTKLLVTTTSVEELLGKKLALTIVNWHNPENDTNGAKVPENATNYLDARLAAVATPATRPTFFFDPMNPSLEIFRDTLTYWTQKTVMDALNASNYPKELHELWVKIQEEKNATIPTTYNTEAIE